MRIPLLRTVDLLAQAVESAGVRTADLHAVLLVGGSSRIPLVSRLIARSSGRPSRWTRTQVRGVPRVRRSPRVPGSPRPPRPPRVSPPACVRPAGAGYTERRPGARLRRAGASPPLRQAVFCVPTTRSPPSPPPPPVAAAADEPPAPLVVDLPATGITAVVDTFVPTTPTVPAWRPVVTDVDEPLVVTVTGDRKRGRRAVLIAAGAAVLVVAALAALLVRPGPAATGDATAPTDTASARVGPRRRRHRPARPRTGDRGAR